MDIQTMRKNVLLKIKVSLFNSWQTELLTEGQIFELW